MKGLMYKDAVTILTSYKKNALLVLALYGMMGIGMNMPGMLCAFPMFWGIYISTSLSFDEYAHFDAYARTLPVSAGQVVAAKYLLGLGFMSFGAVLSVVMMGVAALLGRGMPMEEAIASTLAVLAVVLVYYAVAFPLGYYFGAAKARSATLVAFMAIIFGGTLLGNLLSGVKSKEELLALLPADVTTGQMLLVVAVSLGVPLLLYALSGVVAVRLYRKKEF